MSKQYIIGENPDGLECAYIWIEGKECLKPLVVFNRPMDAIEKTIAMMRANKGRYLINKRFDVKNAISKTEINSQYKLI